MWIFTKDGFFSVVKDDYCEDGEVMVRVRARIDLERLLGKISGDTDGIIEVPHADYRYRAKVPRQLWADYCHAVAGDIDYPTVKDTVAGGDDSRQAAYYGCWASLYDWQGKVG